MTKSRRVWAIYYTVRVNRNTSWCKKWVGPCGVGVIMKIEIHNSFLQDCLSHRPFFFRTRALARLRVVRLLREKNITWNWVKYTVKPITLSWTEGD